jgi:hypothetical protein
MTLYINILISVIVGSLVYFFILPQILKWLNKKLKKKDDLSVEEINTILNENFSFQYQIILYLLIAVFVTVFIAGGIIGYGFLLNLQENIFFGQDKFIYFIPALTSIIFCVISFSLAFVSGISVFYFLSLFSPKLTRLIIRNIYKMSGSRERPTPRRTLLNFIKYSFLIILIGTPFAYMAMNDYMYASEEKFYYNKFSSLKEKNINWDELEKVKIGLWMNSNGEGVNYEYKLIFDNNKEFNLEPKDWDRMAEFTNFLKNKNAKFEKGIFENEAMIYLNEHSSSGMIATFKKALDMEK